ncbi:MAG: hypothetical protein HY047_03730, partial [Acidobacteria bacterium]|nr:hypothetical protein [Acidobacteriota bacterium]
KFDSNGQWFTGPPTSVAATYSATVNEPLSLSTWAIDEGPKINIPEGRGRGRGRGAAGRAGADAAAGRAGGDAAAGGAARSGAEPAAGAARGAGGGRGAASAADAAGAAATGGFTPAPPLSITWTVFRGPGSVKFDPVAPPIDKESGKSTTTATFSAPGDYTLRVQGNDSTGNGGGGFQCCWSNTYVTVNVKPASVSAK